MAEKVFLNDKLVDTAQAKVSVADSGLLYGAGLFETMISRNGKVFRLDDHIERLSASSIALSIITFDKKFLTDAIYQTLEANELSDARLRLTVTNGSMRTDEQLEPTVLVTATKLQPYPDEYYSNGVLVVLSTFRQNPTDPLCGHKTTNYFARMIALNQARSKQAAEALWFTNENRLAEGCISNVFLVKDSVVLTPGLDTPVLGGVARKAVCTIAEKNGIEVQEKELFIKDLLEADEIFMTNVIMQVLPVNAVEQHSGGNGKVGPVTGKLRELFGQYVEQECGESK